MYPDRKDKSPRIPLSQQEMEHLAQFWILMRTWRNSMEKRTKTRRRKSGADWATVG